MKQTQTKSGNETHRKKTRKQSDYARRRLATPSVGGADLNARSTADDLVAGDPRRHREGLAHAHALLAVDEETVALDHEVVLERRLGAEEVLQGVLRLAQLALQLVDGLVQFVDLFDESAKRRRSIL